MEKIVRQTLLFDFYGELLTEHQQRIYEAVVCNDTSCSEVAQDEGVSRQGIHDLVRRCEKQLEEYEQKLHMMDRFLSIREKARLISKEVSEARQGVHEADLQLIAKAADDILEEL